MGSGNQNRKKTDNIFIRLPKANVSLGLGVGVRIEEAAEVCIPSFDVLLKASSLTHDGVKVELKASEKLYLVTIGGIEVGQLSSANSEMVNKCIKWGVKYRGVIITKREKPYARFSRSSR